MNTERIAGMCKELAGRFNEALGRRTGNQWRAAAGRRCRIAGELQQRDAVSQEHSLQLMREFLHRNRNWTISVESKYEK